MRQSRDRLGYQEEYQLGYQMARQLVEVLVEVRWGKKLEDVTREQRVGRRGAQLTLVLIAAFAIRGVRHLDVSLSFASCARAWRVKILLDLCSGFGGFLAASTARTPINSRQLRHKLNTNGLCRTSSSWS